MNPFSLLEVGLANPMGAAIFGPQYETPLTHSPTVKGIGHRNLVEGGQGIRHPAAPGLSPIRSEIGAAVIPHGDGVILVRHGNRVEIVEENDLARALAVIEVNLMTPSRENKESCQDQGISRKPIHREFNAPSSGDQHRYSAESCPCS